VHEPIIEARGLTKRFGKVVAIDGLDLEIQRGESVAVVGVAGAGKSTLLRLLAGLSRPTGGVLTMAGVVPASRQGLGARRQVGFLDQEPAFYDWMTGRELLVFAAALLGVERAEIDDRVTQMLDLVGLTGLAENAIGGWSLDARQRLGIGQALLGEPGILLLDEPLGWLDPPGRRDLREAIRGRRGSGTVVLATADLVLAEAIADRLVVLDAGKVLAASGTAELLDRILPRDYVIEAAPGPGLALAGLAARLEGERWVRAVEAVDGTLRVAVRDQSRAERELMPAVVGTGLAVLQLRRERPGVSELVDRLRAESR
jgi:ABC-2 type transport system ATP-binding protein